MLVSFAWPETQIGYLTLVEVYIAGQAEVAGISRRSLWR